VQDIDKDGEEIIAVAAASGFAAPDEIRAERISVDGTLLRFSDAAERDLLSSPASAPAFTTLNGSAGGLVSVRGYYEASAGVLAGRAFGTEASGIRAASAAEFGNVDAFILSNGSGGNRFPVRAGTDGGLGASEVRALLEEAFKVMSAARAQIRRPLDSRAQVSISAVDTNGAVLGVVRSPDAPVFGIDVSLQKPAPRPSSRARRRLLCLAPARMPRCAPSSWRRRPSSPIRPRSPAPSPSRRERSATSRAPIFPTASWAARRGPSRGRSRNSIPSRPGFNPRSSKRM
jgi:hypothetical protein